MNKNTYNNFGPVEMNVISILSYEKTIVITAEEIDSIFGFTTINRAKLVNRLKKKNILTSIRTVC